MVSVDLTNPEIIDLVETLNKLGVTMKSYVVNNDPRHPGIKSFNFCAGVEELINYGPADTDKIIHQVFTKVLREDRHRQDIMLEYSDRMPFVIPDEPINYKNIKLLLKYKEVKGLDKKGLEEFMVESGLTVQPWTPKNKMELEANICYIYKDKPSTNSLALSEQFSINHQHVVRTIFEILRTEPSYFNHIHWNAHTYESGRNSTTTTLHLEIDEKVYQKFIRKLGKPKSDEMYIFRERKMEEYYVAFKNMRDDYYRTGGSEQEMAELKQRRKEATERLLDTTSIYVQEFNRKPSTKGKLNYSTLQRILFNLINKKLELNSLDHGGRSRDFANTRGLEFLSTIENMIYFYINKGDTKTPKEIVRLAFNIIDPEKGMEGLDKIDEHIRKSLSDYNVEHLFAEICDFG